jgi:hypothetical protein
MFKTIIEANKNELKYWKNGIIFGVVSSVIGMIGGMIIEKKFIK